MRTAEQLAELRTILTDAITELDDNHGPLDEPYLGADYCTCDVCQRLVPMLTQSRDAIDELIEWRKHANFLAIHGITPP